MSTDTGMRAIWFCDPGVSSGVAWGIFNLKSTSVAEAMQERMYSGSTTIVTPGYGTKDLQEQARRLYASWRQFKIESVNKHFIYPESVVVGMEDFVLYPKVHTPGIEGIFPAYVIGAFEGYRLAHYDRFAPKNGRHYTDLVRQQASLMTRYNKQDVLKRGNCWIRGRDHERSAFSHIWAYLNANLV